MSGSINGASGVAGLLPSLASDDARPAAAPAGTAPSGNASSGTAISVATNADGSVTTTITDADGNVVSTSTVAGDEAGTAPGSRLDQQV